MTKTLSDSRLANLGANAILDTFDTYQTWFKIITRRARTRFENREWHPGQLDASERLNLYKQTIDQLVPEVRELLGDRLQDKLVWSSLKAVYSGLLAGRRDWDIAETFFNSVTRQIFATVGLDPQIEFVDSDFESPPIESNLPVYKTYATPATTRQLVEQILADFPFKTAYQNYERDVQAAAIEIDSYINYGPTNTISRAEMITSVFYRGKGAYLVGRVWCNDQAVPLAFALLNTAQGLLIDAVVMNEDELGIVFSFTRSYFHVEVERPYDLVRFLKSLMPRKRLAEHYISIGYNKHGKTELYRDLLHHLSVSTDQFEIARGELGMVMSVFTLPSFEVVFKVIKDRFAYPKNSTRQEVMAQYQMVFKHDRAGRLVDAQEYEHLKFDRKRFSADLLAHLREVATKTVTIEDDFVIVKHVYVERRVIPLNLYVREAEPAAAEAVVVEMGNAIKDLAATNIFTGDMLLKNFGVTRHGRVVFYDYDELTSLTDCTFRHMPEATTPAQDIADTPWFSVGVNDVFPEEFKYFLGLGGRLREVFMQHHANLFEVSFWQKIQAYHKAGEVLDIFPYKQSQHLSSQTRTENLFSDVSHSRLVNDF